MNFSIIAAVTRDYGLGCNNGLPWSHCATDLKWFSQQTRNTTVIMGRNTFKSLGCKGLNERINIVISNSSDFQSPSKKQRTNKKDGEVFFLQSFDIALLFARRFKREVFVIGGAQIYQIALNHPACRRILLTHLNIKLTVDCYFPNLSADHYRINQIIEKGSTEVLVHEQPCNVPYEIIEYLPFYNTRGPSMNYQGESGYLQCLRDVMEYGEDRIDRTNVGTKALYGTNFRYDLTAGIPLFTTKNTFWKGVVAELLWFLSGSTDVTVLQRQGVTIWNGNSTREYLDRSGHPDLTENTIGASYSFQFRHSGATYRGAEVDYRGLGFDQVNYVIEQLRQNPQGRRAIINLWNPSDLDKMAIPPCLYSYQFWVDNQKGLSCLITQRSGDLGLGIPFNVASASLLTYMIAHLTGYQAKELIHNVADTHIYKTHLDALSKQIKRIPRPFPQLTIVKRDQKKVEDFVKEDFILSGYYPYPMIKMEMAV